MRREQSCFVEFHLESRRKQTRWRKEEEDEERGAQREKGGEEVMQGEMEEQKKTGKIKEMEKRRWKWLFNFVHVAEIVSVFPNLKNIL